MPTSTDMSIGERFKSFRLQTGLSQAQLAEGICSYSVISQIEFDRALPSAHTLGKLAERLGIPLREITGPEEGQMDVRFQLDVIRAHIANRDYSHALYQISELERNYELLEHQLHVLLLCKSECLIRTADPKGASTLLVPFIEDQVSKPKFDEQVLCEAYNKLGTAYYHLYDWQKAYATYEQGYRIGLKIKQMNRVTASTLLNLGICCNQLGMREDATRYLKKAYEYYKSNSDLPSLANSLFSLAIATEKQEYITQALHLYESVHDIRNAFLAQQHYLFHFESKKNYLHAAHAIGEIADRFITELTDYELGVYVYSRAFMICHKNDDQELASDFLTRVESYMEHVTDKGAHALAYYHRCKAMHHISKQDYGEAVTHSTISSQLYAKIEMHQESADSLQLSADALTARGMYKQACEVFREVTKILRKTGRMSDE